MLGVGLLDILTLPRRHQIAQSRLEQGQLQLTSDVVDKVTQVRQAWVNAVGAQQSLSYAKQVSDSAEASAELAPACWKWATSTSCNAHDSKRFMPMHQHSGQMHRILLRRLANP